MSEPQRRRSDGTRSPVQKVADLLREGIVGAASGVATLMPAALASLFTSHRTAKRGRDSSDHSPNNAAYKQAHLGEDEDKDEVPELISALGPDGGQMAAALNLADLHGRPGLPAAPHDLQAAAVKEVGPQSDVNAPGEGGGAAKDVTAEEHKILLAEFLAFLSEYSGTAQEETRQPKMDVQAYPGTRATQELTTASWLIFKDCNEAHGRVVTVSDLDPLMVKLEDHQAEWALDRVHKLTRQYLTDLGPLDEEVAVDNLAISSGVSLFQILQDAEQIVQEDE